MGIISWTAETADCCCYWAVPALLSFLLYPQTESRPERGRRGELLLMADWADL